MITLLHTRRNDFYAFNDTSDIIKLKINIKLQYNFLISIGVRKMYCELIQIQNGLYMDTSG